MAIFLLAKAYQSQFHCRTLVIVLSQKNSSIDLQSDEAKSGYLT